MKNKPLKKSTTTSPNKMGKALASSHPTKAELKNAIKKSIKKNKETLKILAKR